MQYRAPECKHSMLPGSLNLGTKNNDEWDAHFKSVAPFVTDGKVSSFLIDMLQDPRINLL